MGFQDNNIKIYEGGFHSDDDGNINAVTTYETTANKEPEKGIFMLVIEVTKSLTTRKPRNIKARGDIFSYLGALINTKIDEGNDIKNNPPTKSMIPLMTFRALCYGDFIYIIIKNKRGGMKREEIRFVPQAKDHDLFRNVEKFYNEMYEDK